MVAETPELFEKVVKPEIDDLPPERLQVGAIFLHKKDPA